MLPTSSTNCGKRWWQPPDFHYSFKSSYAWPAVPVEGAAAAGATAATAAEGAASHLAAGAAGALGAGAGAGGIPPRGPGFGYRHYHSNNPYGYRGLRRGGRPSRLVWFGIGAITAGFWYRHHEHKKEELQRYIADPGSWRHTWSQTNDSTNTAAPALDVKTAPIPSPQALPEETKHRGWKSWSQKRDEYWARKYEESRQREDAKRQAVDASAATAIPSPTAAIEVKDSGLNGNADEMAKIRESIEKIWEEKKRNANEAQEKASEQAREYASQKLDKLSAALDTLRESLKQDAKSNGKSDADSKWV